MLCYRGVTSQTVQCNINCVHTGAVELPPQPKTRARSRQPTKHCPSAGSFSPFTSITGYGSDFGSVKTEDFESRFQDLIVKQSSTGTQQQTRSGKTATVKKPLPAMPTACKLSRTSVYKILVILTIYFVLFKNIVNLYITIGIWLQE